MAGGDVLRAELVGALDEPAELEVLVAHHARIRRAAGLVFLGEVLDDLALELRRFVNEVIGNAQLVADGAGVRDWPAGRSTCPRRARRSPAARA